MANTELSADLLGLEASQSEITKIEELQERHERLLRESAENESAEKKTLGVSIVNDFLTSLADAGAVIQYPEYRSQLRALILYWSKFIEEKTGTFPLVQLEPYKVSQSEVPTSTTITNVIRRAVEQEKQIVKRDIQEAEFQRNLHQLDLQRLESEYKLNLTKEKLAQTRNKSILLTSLGLIAGVILGFGINLVTTFTSGWTGWALVITAIILNIVIFFFNFKHEYD